MVARVKGCDRCTDTLHDADAFMPEDSSRCAAGYIAFEDVQIRSTDRGLDDPDDRVRRHGNFRHRPVFERLLSRPLIDKRFHADSLPGWANNCLIEAES